MDDPSQSWPAWKFGMKRDDLYTKLHDQYNTFTFTLQDPEAFHHDVYEVSHDAHTADEFHRLMADRRRQRLQELHESLESLAVEIVANPKLMGSEHWQYALQLFRTRSFDSIVQYFASYLPEDYLERHDTLSVSSFSDTHSVETESTTASSVDDASLPSFFDDEPAMTKEPFSIHTNIRTSTLLETPLSPPHSEVEVMHSGSSINSPTDMESRGFSSNPPSRSMSFSESESEAFAADMVRDHIDDDDETSQSEDSDFAVASDSDCAESRSPLDMVDDLESCDEGQEEDVEDEFPTAQFPEDASDDFDFYNDTPESDTPTPRQETTASCYTEDKPVASWRILSPHHRSASLLPKLHHPYRREGTALKGIRRSPDESHSKIQKPTLDPIRRRPLGRKRQD